MNRPDPEVDEAMAVAEIGQASVIDVERLVRTYALYAGQDRPPPEDKARARDVKILRGEDGTGSWW